jgi:CRISPR-associated exonuclease Cas4
MADRPDSSFESLVNMPEFTDDYPPLSALNDLLYCERRCALHRIENVWVENAHTLAGTLSHKRADKQVEWKCENVRAVHGMWLKSNRLRLVGKADVVEFQQSAAQGDRFNSPERPESCCAQIVPVPFCAYPVEYKRGKRRKWDNDDVQLCAQALCLEEMLGLPPGGVPAGAIFHIRSKRRREVVFTDKLRAKTEAAAARLHELIAAGVTPPAVLKPQCDGCSLRQVCLPELPGGSIVMRYCAELLKVEGDEG